MLHPDDDDFYYGALFGSSMDGGYGGRSVGPTGQRIVVAFFAFCIGMLLLTILKGCLYGPY